MLKFFSIIVLITFFVGCTPSSFQLSKLDEKQALIKKANSGDIKAMLELAKSYHYPYTTQGLDYFTRWYDDIDKNDDAKDIYDIALVYDEYKDMFVNGKQKVKKLYELSSQKGYLKAKFQLIQIKDNFDEELSLDFSKMVPILSDDEVNELYNYYNHLYNKTKLHQLVTYLQTNNVPLPFAYYEDELRKYYRNKDNEKIEKIVAQIVASKNATNIFKLADSYYLSRDKDRVIEIYQEGLKLDPKNAKMIYKLAQVYSNKSYQKKDSEMKNIAIELLGKAARLGDKDAISKILKIYASDKIYLTQYFELIKKLEETTEGKIQIAKYYLMKNKTEKASKILDKLAQKGNHSAIVTLGSIRQSRGYFDPDSYLVSQKWLQYILNSNDKMLQKLFLDENNSYSEKKYFAKEIELLQKSNLVETENILFLRKKVREVRYGDFGKRLQYQLQAAQTGDKKSIMDLYILYLNKKNITEALKTIDILAEKNDIESINRLASFYLYPPSDFKEMKNIKKALFYKEKAASLGDIGAMQDLAQKYLCGDCYSDVEVNYEKAKIYIEKLHDLGYPKYTYTLGWLYNFGKGVDQDLEKAKEYYIESSKKGYLKGYYTVGWWYYKGEFVKQDYKKAFEYFKKALPYSDAFNMLGIFYENGHEVTQDYAKAIEYYEQSNTDISNYNLGQIYEKGIVAPKDIEKAKYWYQRSREKEAQERLKELNKITQ
ncbi:MAG: hypothetical protein WBG69_00110 [Arcobacteraceae bacterium]